MIKKIDKHQLIVILMFALLLINFFYNNANKVQYQPTRQTMVIQHILIFMRYVLFGLMVYFIKNELRFEKVLCVYGLGLFSGLILVGWIFIVRITHPSASAPFSIFIGQNHPLRYAEIIMISIHALSVLPLLFNRHYDWMIKLAFFFIIAGQIMFFLSKFDGLTVDETRVFVHAPYFNADAGYYNIIYFLTKGILYTLMMTLSTLSLGFIVYKLTPHLRKEAPQEL